MQFAVLDLALGQGQVVNQHVTAPSQLDQAAVGASTSPLDTTDRPRESTRPVRVGYKDRPKSDASIRPVPRADPVAAAAMTRRLEGCGRDELAFSGPRGSNGIPPVTAVGR